MLTSRFLRTFSVLFLAVSVSIFIGCDDTDETSDGSGGEGGTGAIGGEGGSSGAGATGGEGGAGATGGEGGAGATGGEGGAGATGGEGGAGATGGAGGEAGAGAMGGAGGQAGAGGGTTGTAGVLCELQADGMQRLVYEHGRPGRNLSSIDVTLPYRYAWTCSDTERTLSANGVPNHGVVDGRFATQISEQNIQYSVSLTPDILDNSTRVRVPGFALNGVKFEPGTAGTCPNDASSDTDCSYAMGRDQWQMVATPGETSPWRFGFGVDENDAHVQPNGQYHYHGDPLNLVAILNPDFESSMTLIGWAADGFPMYSLHGHTDPQDSASPLVEMRSSYRTVDTPAAGRPAVEDFALGHFEQDWAFVDGSGDLDACNGRFGVTPEFPEGVYHYYTTRTYPFVQRCVRGTAAAGGNNAGRRRPGRP